MLKLPQLGPFSITGGNGLPTTSFQSWVNSAFKKIEQGVTSLQTQLGLIEDAQSAADAANLAALAAQSDADAANAALTSIASDNVLSVVEKKTVVREYADIIAEQTDIDAKATTYGITTEKTAYDTAVSALTTYLGTLTTPSAWNSFTTTTTIVGSTFRTKFSDVYATRQTLLNKIALEAGKTSTWAGVTGSGRPADNATVNIVTRSSSAPSSPVNGDIWVDTSATPNVVKVRVSGAWQQSSTNVTTADHFADGTTYARIRATQLSSGYHTLTVDGSGQRIGGVRNLPQISGQGLRYKFTGAITYTSTAGTPATATINVAAGSSYIGSSTVNYNAMSVGTSGTNSTTVIYYLYVDDPGYAGGSQTLVATSNGDIPYQSDSRVFIGSVSVTYPGAGGGSGGGGGGSGWCVAYDAWVETKNRGFVMGCDIVPGDELRVLTDDLQSTEWAPVLSNKTKAQPSVQIRSKSGITLRVSANTPITLRDGSSIDAEEIDGHELPVWTDALDWEQCTVQPIGELLVCYISLGSRVYAAGDKPGRAIFTHNITAKP